MNILLLAPQPFFQERGTPIAVRLLAETLGQAGHRLTLLVFAGGQDIALTNCATIRVPTPGGAVGPGFSWQKAAGDAAMLRRASRLARRQRFDLVHAVEEAGFIALYLKRRFGIPYVYDMDSLLSRQLVDRFPWLAPGVGLLEAMEKRVVRAACGLLPVCRELEDRVRAWAPATPLKRLEDISLLPPAAAEGEPDPLPGLDGPILLYVGNLEPYQGIDLLLDAFALAARENAQATLVVVGGVAGHVRRYRERADALGIAGRVLFTGPRPVAELGVLCRRATVLVSPRTRGGNTPMKIYSYLDSGRPVLATRLATHMQVLDDDVALLVDPEPRAMAAGMLTLLADPDLCRDLAARARLRVAGEFSRAAFDGKLLSFYDQVGDRIARAKP